MTATLVVVWSAFAILVYRGDTPRRICRIVLVVATMVTAALLNGEYWSQPRPVASDLAPVWASARALAHGSDPYAAVGPGRSYDTRFPQIYPLTAILPIVPLSALRLRSADALFTALSFGMFAWAVTRRRLLAPPLAALVSLPGLMALQTSQWSPLLSGAALLPAAGWLLVAKPTIGSALFAAFPRVSTAVGGAILLAASFAAWPSWLPEWRATLDSAPHVVAPIMRTGGPLMLLALARWKRADARLLVALSCVPQTTTFYETIPLFLIAETWPQAAGLSALSLAALACQWWTGPYPTVEAHWASGAQWIVLLMYLPCLAIVLRRPNVWSVTINAGSDSIDELETADRANARAATSPLPADAC